MSLRANLLLLISITTFIFDFFARHNPCLASILHMVTRPSILLIDDSPGERELFGLSLAQTGLDITLYTEQSTEAAFRFLESRVPYSSNRFLDTVGGRVSTELGECQAHSGRVRTASTEDRSGLPCSLPSLILLDLHLCGQNGCDLLKRLRSDARFAALPVVVFTTSDDLADLANSYSCGANGYEIKPGNFDELVRCTTNLCRNWLTWSPPATSDTVC